MISFHSSPIEPKKSLRFKARARPSLRSDPTFAFTQLPLEVIIEKTSRFRVEARSFRCRAGPEQKEDQNRRWAVGRHGHVTMT